MFETFSTQGPEPLERYGRLVRAAQSGNHFPRGEIDAILAAAGKTHMDLAYDVLAGPSETPGAQPGDPCAYCGQSIGIRSSRKQGLVVIQYLRCRACGLAPEKNKRVIPALSVQRRKRCSYNKH